MPSHYYDKETMKTEKSTRKSQPTTHGNHKAQKHKAFIESPLLLRLWREKAKGISRGGGRHGWHTTVLQSHQAQLWLAWTEWLHHADRRKDGREAVEWPLNNSHMKERNQTTGTTNGRRILVSGSPLLIRRWGRKFEEDMHDSLGHGTNV